MNRDSSSREEHACCGAQGAFTISSIGEIASHPQRSHCHVFNVLRAAYPLTQQRPMSYQQPLRILLIEDTPADARLIQTILRPPSFEVTVVERLSSALALLHTMHIDVILLDLTLPDSRGPDALEAIREGSPGTAIVVIAGNDDLETALDAVARGAHHYVIKERSSEETIVSSVRQAFERSRAEKFPQ